MKLNAASVQAVMVDCLAPRYDPGNPTDSVVVVEGIVSSAAFVPAKITRHRTEIRDMLSQLPAQFRKDEGGGWSFLNACMNSSGEQWASLHRTMEELFMLGTAAGYVSLALPRDMWGALPGGMPYYIIDLDAE